MHNPGSELSGTLTPSAVNRPDGGPGVSEHSVKTQAIAPETSASAMGTGTNIVESPQNVHPAHETSFANDSLAGLHLSGHEARAFPGIFTRGRRGGSARRDDAHPVSRPE
jgi:hypothetical protein